MHPRSLIIVAPYFEDGTAVREWLAELKRLPTGTPYVVLVDDGSVGDPASAEWLREVKLSGAVLRLQRNVGHQRAIATGLGFVAEYSGNSERIVVMDSDGEDRPQDVPSLLAALGPSFDVVVAERKRRIESLLFLAFYRIYQWLFHLLTGRSIAFGNFMALSAESVRRIASMHEATLHIAGAVLVSRLRVARLPLDRGARYAGQSKMNFVGLVLHGFRAIMVFAEDVLVRVGLLCAFVAAMSIVGALAAVTLKVIGFSTPGWFSVALGILVLMFMQTGALSLMMLMLTGVVRLGGERTANDYRGLVSSIDAHEESTCADSSVS